MLGKLSILGRNRETYVVNSYHTFIGSHSKCDIRVYGPGISPQHCVVTTQGDSSATIRNLPHNGTTLVNECDIGMSDFSLSQNDVIKIGNTKIMWSKADGKKSSSKDSSGRLVAVVMPQKRSSDEFSNSATKRPKLGDTSSLAHSSSLSSFSGQWERRTPKRSLVHSTPAVRRHSRSERTESFRLLTTSNFFDDSTLQEESLVDETLESERNFSPRSSVKKVCFTSKRMPRKALPSFESPAQKSILKKPTDGLSTPTNVRRTMELNFRSPRNSSLRAIMASPSSTPMRPLHTRRVALTEPRRVLSRTNLSNQIDALCLEKSLLAAKKLKSEPPKLMDKKKLAALLVCHKKKSPRKDFDEGPKTPQPKRKSELDNLFIDMKFSTDKKSPKKSDPGKSNLSKSASSPSILINNQTSIKTQRLTGNSPSVENMSLGLCVESLNESSISQKMSKSKQYKSHALSQLNIDMNDSPKRSVKYSIPSSENDENLSKKSKRSKSLENKPTNAILDVNISPKRSSKAVKNSVDEKGTKNMSVALKRLHIDMNDFPSRGRKTKSLVSKSDHKENSNKKLRSKSLENSSKPTSIVLPSNVLDSGKSKSRALSRLTIDMNDSPKGSKSPSTPERVKKDLTASLNFSSVASNSEKKHKPMMMRAENNLQFASEKLNLPSLSPKVDIPQIPDLNLSLGIAKNVARILSPLKDKAKRILAESPSQESSTYIQELDKATRMSAASPSISQESSPLTDVLEDDLLNALHLSRKSTIVEKPKQPVRRLRSFNRNVNGIQQLFSSEYKQYSKEEVKKLFDDDPKPSTSVGDLKRKLYSPIPDNANIKSMDRVFTTSPVVDYTDTSGVKRLFTISPKADYRDPRGIKELFAVSKTNYLDVSGVGDLFANKSRTSLGSNKRKSILVKKTEKRASLAKPQKDNASLKDRLEKKLSLKNSVENDKTKVKEEPLSPKMRATKKTIAVKSERVKKESLNLSTSPPRRVLRLRGAKPESPRKSVATVSTKASSRKKAVEKPTKEVKTRKRGAKQASSPEKESKTKRTTKKTSSPAKELKTKKRATKKVLSPAEDVETASNSEKEVKTKKRVTKKVSSPAKNIVAASSSAKESKTKRTTKKASSPVKELKTKKRATKKVVSPAKDAASSSEKEVKTKKKAAKKVLSPGKVVKAAASPAKESKTRKRAAKKVPSPAKVVETASSPAKELKTRKRATKKVPSPTKVVEAASSSSKELKTRKRVAKKVSSPAKAVEAASISSKELKTKTRVTKKAPSLEEVASSPEKEVKTKKRMTKNVSADEVKTKKATKQTSSPAKEAKGKKNTKNQATSLLTKTKKVTKKTEEASSSRSVDEPSTSRAKTKKVTKKSDTAKQPKSPAKPTKSKASPKKSSAKKPRLIVKITPPKVLGSILKKPKGRPKAAKKVLFEQDKSLSPSPPKKKTQKKK